MTRRGASALRRFGASIVFDRSAPKLDVLPINRKHTDERTPCTFPVPSRFDQTVPREPLLFMNPRHFLLTILYPDLSGRLYRVCVRTYVHTCVACSAGIPRGFPRKKRIFLGLEGKGEEKRSQFVWLDGSCTVIRVFNHSLRSPLDSSFPLRFDYPPACSVSLWIRRL